MIHWRYLTYKDRQLIQEDGELFTHCLFASEQEAAEYLKDNLIHASIKQSITKPENRIAVNKEIKVDCPICGEEYTPSTDYYPIHISEKPCPECEDARLGRDEDGTH